MTISTGGFPELLWPGIHDIWGNSYNNYEPLYTKIFEQKSSKQRFEKEQGVTGFGLAGIKDEGQAVPYTDPYQGYQKEYVHTVYAVGTSVTREMVDDEMYQYINQIPKMLAESMRQTEETVAFNHINRAQNSSYTGADGLSLASGSHTLVGGGTFSNQLAVAADLSQTSLETAIQNLMDFVDDQSLKIRVLPKALVVPTALNFTARKLLESEFVVGSADNDKNTTAGILNDLIVSPFITDSDSWSIVTDVPNGLVWYDRWDAELNRDNEFDTQNLKIFQVRRFSSGWTDPRGIFYTPGA